MALVGAVARSVDAAALADAAMARRGRIDVLDSNAARYGPADVLDRDKNERDRVQEVNVRGTYQYRKHVIPNMAARHEGAIVNMDSIVSLIALDGPKNLGPAYVASEGTDHLLCRFGRPEAVAAAVLFLALDESSFVTSSPRHVDGGFLGH